MLYLKYVVMKNLQSPMKICRNTCLFFFASVIMNAGDFMKRILFKGCGTAICTPFNDSGVNFEEFKKLINFQVDNGADAIIVCGTTGEASTMTTEEKLMVEFLSLLVLVVITQNKLLNTLKQLKS